jgi:hypothetical protein
VQGSTGVEVAPASGGTDAERARRVLAQKREAAKRGDEVPHEERLTLTDPCIAIGYARPNPDPKAIRPARTPHDLRRSGVKHYIDAGVDPHTVMQWSGHRTESMLRRYHIIDLEDLRRAGKRASEYRGPADNVHPLRDGAPPSIEASHYRTITGPRKTTQHGQAAAELSEC